MHLRPLGHLSRRARRPRWGAGPSLCQREEREQDKEITVRWLAAALASGERGIRTLGTLASTHDFQSCTFGHSVISPDPAKGGLGTVDSTNQDPWMDPARAGGRIARLAVRSNSS